MTWAFKVEAKAGDDIEITLYDVIGKDFFGEGVSAKDVLDALRKSPKAKRITLRVNSLGGIVTEAFAMANAINERRKAGAEVIAYVDGTAASAAAYLLTTASRVVMPENAFIMIHRVRGGARGNADDVATVAEVMRRMDGQLAKAFADMSARRGKGKTEADFLESFAKGDHYLDAKEAVEWGFVDETSPALQVAATLADISEITDAPSALLEQPYIARGELSPVDVRAFEAYGVAKEIATQTSDRIARVGDAITVKLPNASAADGGAPNTPKGSKHMTKEELKAQHPELYASVHAEGVTAERDRAGAHLALGEASGDMKTAIEAVLNGTEMTQTLTAKYLAAGMRRNEQAARQTESDAAGAAVSNLGSEPAAEDFGDKVAAAMKKMKGGAL